MDVGIVSRGLPRWRSRRIILIPRGITVIIYTRVHFDRENLDVTRRN